MSFGFLLDVHLVAGHLLPPSVSSLCYGSMALFTISMLTRLRHLATSKPHEAYPPRRGKPSPWILPHTPPKLTITTPPSFSASQSGIDIL